MPYRINVLDGRAGAKGYVFNFTGASNTKRGVSGIQ